LAADSFATGMDWKERLAQAWVECDLVGSHFLISDLDFTNDVAILTKLFQLLVPALETMAGLILQQSELGGAQLYTLAKYHYSITLLRMDC